MKTYNLTKFEDVVEFMGVVNKAIYGVNPYSKKLEVKHL